MTPYSSPAQHFADHTARMLLCLRRHILLHWRRVVDADGKLSDLFVSLDEVSESTGALSLAEPKPQVVVDEETSGALERLRVEIRVVEARISTRLALTTRCELPIEDICAMFRLSEAERDVVVFLACLQTHTDFYRLCTFAWGDFSRKQPDLAFVVELLCQPANRHAELLAALAPGANLTRYQVLHISEAPEWRPETPHLFKRAALANRLIHCILVGTVRTRVGESTLYRPLEAAATLDSLCIDEARVGEAKRLVTLALRGAGDHAQIVHLLGPDGVGKTELAAALAASLDRRLWVVSLDTLRDLSSEQLAWELPGLSRDAMLARAFMLQDLRGASLDAGEASDRALIRGLTETLARFATAVFAASHGPVDWLASLGEVRSLVIPYTSPSQQARAWRQSLGDSVSLGGTPVPVDYLVRRLNLTAGPITAIARAASHRERAGRRDPSAPVRLDEGVLMRAVRSQLRHRLGSLAVPLHTECGWDDLVVPASTMDELREIEASLREKPTVLTEWGFSRLAGSQRGTSILFSGPPGTGKTFCATLLGEALGREVFRIDLSRVVNKYIGETEKNLARLFDESEYAQVLLLFDEADSLFGRRTNVESSHDRFNNMQVNFLLQRIETYEGVCVLTTNYQDNIDEVFKPRIRFQLHFSEPDAALRERLWRSMIPAKAKMAPDISWSKLAKSFNFSGGRIRNSVLRAAYAAAARNEAIGEAHLLRAARAEAQQLGLLYREEQEMKR